jgi:hypothetical protein
MCLCVCVCVLCVYSDNGGGVIILGGFWLLCSAKYNSLCAQLKNGCGNLGWLGWGGVLIEGAFSNHGLRLISQTLLGSPRRGRTFPHTKPLTTGGPRIPTPPGWRGRSSSPTWHTMEIHSCRWAANVPLAKVLADDRKMQMVILVTEQTSEHFDL